MVPDFLMFFAVFSRSVLAETKPRSVVDSRGPIIELLPRYLTEVFFSIYRVSFTNIRFSKSLRGQKSVKTSELEKSKIQLLIKFGYEQRVPKFSDLNYDVIISRL